MLSKVLQFSNHCYNVVSLILMKILIWNYNSTDWEILSFPQVNEFVHCTLVECILDDSSSVKCRKLNEQSSPWLPEFQSGEENQELQLHVNR